MDTLERIDALAGNLTRLEMRLADAALCIRELARLCEHGGAIGEYRQGRVKAALDLADKADTAVAEARAYFARAA